MSGTTKQPAMPRTPAPGVSEETGINPGKAGPKGALEERPSRKLPSSGARGNEGNNTRRDFVNGPSAKRGARKGHR
jgi:hypothetical protein